MQERDRERIENIIGFCDRILLYSDAENSGYEQFRTDYKTQDACILCVIQIGEVIVNLSDEIRGKYPDVPWQAIKRTRNVYVHNYGNVDPEFVWELIVNEIPALKRRCLEILSDESGLKSE